MDNIQILKEAQIVFFEALLEGYAGKTKSIKKITSPNGYKTLTFSKGDFTVLDMYCVTPYSDCSCGTTTIFYKDKPVWWMSYGGEYPKKVILFLKKVLRQSYEVGEFNGCRGRKNVCFGSYLYMNHFVGDFSFFQGEEKIFEEKKGEHLGHHRYFGMSLI
jgi:hypothetical protein